MAYFPQPVQPVVIEMFRQAFYFVFPLGQVSHGIEGVGEILNTGSEHAGNVSFLWVVADGRSQTIAQGKAFDLTAGVAVLACQ